MTSVAALDNDNDDDNDNDEDNDNAQFAPSSECVCVQQKNANKQIFKNCCKIFYIFYNRNANSKNEFSHQAAFTTIAANMLNAIWNKCDPFPNM